MGVFDQFISARLLDRYPQLYRLGQKGEFVCPVLILAYVVQRPDILGMDYKRVLSFLDRLRRIDWPLYLRWRIIKWSTCWSLGMGDSSLYRHALNCPRQGRSHNRVLPLEAALT